MVPVVVLVLVPVVGSLLSQISQSPLTYLLHLRPSIILILWPLIYGHSLLTDDFSYIVVYDSTYDWQDGSKWYDDDITRMQLPSLL